MFFGGCVELFNSSTFFQFFIFLLRYASSEITVDQMVWFNATTSAQARRQDSVTGGAEINFGRAREVYFVWIREGHWGTRNLSQSGSNKQGEEQKLKGFSGQKQVISKKKIK